MRLKAGLRCSRSSGLNAAEAIAHSPRHGRRSRQSSNNYWELAKNTPLESRIGSRPTFIYGTVGERGLAHGAWSAVAATSGAQEWLRPRGVSAPRGTVPSRRSDSGDLRGAGVAPATHVGGQRRAPTGRMPGESPATAMHWLELAPHVWRLRG
jgi:hypothetical protein